MAGIDEYRGSKKWEGLIPSEKAPRVWDEGFRSFLIKYGMLNHVVYDVFVMGEKGDKNEDGLCGTSRYNNDLDAFTKKGLKFNYVTEEGGASKTEYDFTGDYHIVANIVSSPRSFLTAEDNWFGFVALSNDKKELVIVFRGTMTCKEWEENATAGMSQLEGEPPVTGLGLLSNRNLLMCHSGFQQLYEQESREGLESPKQTVNRMVEAHKGTIEKVTVVGHSLGAAMSQLCAVHLARDKVLGDVPILAIGWASPKLANKCLSEWAEEAPNLRILRLRVPIDFVSNTPPEWLFAITTGGYRDMGTELTLDNTNLQEEGLVRTDDGNSPYHNLEQYMHNVDPTRDIALLNKGSLMSACTVMLVGTCGAGKSTLGNFLLFEKPNPDGGFDTGAGHQAVTTECKTLQDSTRPGPPFTVIDTPGIPDPDGNTRAYFDCIVQEARKKGGLNAVVYAINYSVDRTAFERNIENAAILLEQFNKIGCVLLIACRVPGHLPGTSQSGIQAAEQKWNNYVADISSAAGIRSSSTFFLPLDILSPSRDIRRLSTRFSAVNITGDRGMRTFGELKYCAEQRRNVATRHVQLGNDIGRLEKENQTLTDNVVEQARSVGRYDLALRMGAYSGVVDGVSTAIGASQVAAGVAAVETAALVYVGTVAVAGAILGVVVCALIRNAKHKDIQIKKATIEVNKDTITAMTRELMTGQINVDLLATDAAILRKLDAVANKATSA